MTYLTDKTLAKRYGVRRETIWKWARTGTLPRPVNISPGCTRWRADEIEQRDAELAARRPGDGER